MLILYGSGLHIDLGADQPQLHVDAVLTSQWLLASSHPVFPAINTVPRLEQLFAVLSWVTRNRGCFSGDAQVPEVPLAVLSFGRQSCVPWRKAMAAFQAPARSPTGASRPRRMQLAGWPLSEGNGNCLSELPAPNPQVEAPAKQAGRARKQEKQVIGKAPFGGRSRYLERPQPSPAGVSFP